MLLKLWNSSPQQPLTWVERGDIFPNQLHQKSVWERPTQMYREKSRIEHSNPSSHPNTQIQVVILGVVTWIRNDDQSGLWSFPCFHFSQRKWTPLWVVKRKITSKNIFYDLQMDIACLNLPFTQHHARFYRKYKRCSAYRLHVTKRWASGVGSLASWTL